MKIEAISEIGSSEPKENIYKTPAVTDSSYVFGSNNNEGKATSANPEIAVNGEAKSSVGDQFLLSKEAKAFLEAQRIAEEKKKSEDTNEPDEEKKDALNRELEAANKNAEKQLEEADRLRKCMLIAIRMMGGDEVPSSDQRFLRENNIGMYKQAITLSSTKENPKVYKSVLSEEDMQFYLPNQQEFSSIINKEHNAKYPDLNTVLERSEKNRKNK